MAQLQYLLELPAENISICHEWYVRVMSISDVLHGATQQAKDAQCMQKALFRLRVTLQARGSEHAMMLILHSHFTNFLYP